MKVYIGLPTSKYVNAEPFADILRWAQGSKHDVWMEIQTGYGVDQARSGLITKAIAWGADVLIMLDMDVIPETPLKDILSYAAQDFARGYALIISPTLSTSLNLMVFRTPQFKSPSEVPTNNVFEIEWGALGLAVFDGKELPKLKRVGEQPFINGAAKPLYCVYMSKTDKTEAEGEDCSLCRNVRVSTLKKVGAEPRILVNHIKEGRIPSWRVEFAQAVKAT